MAQMRHGFNPHIALAEHGIAQSPEHKPGVLTDTITAADLAYLEHHEITALEPLGNEELPIYPLKEEIVRTVEENPVTIVKSATGTGKSTQLPQMFYDAGWDVVIVQPRRSAANGVRERISEEISQKRGPFVGDYITSLHTGEKMDGPDDAHIKVETDGTRLVKELDERNIVHDPTVYILDEAHEQGENVEILMAMLKNKLKKEPHLPIRIVIVSATINPQKFVNYFADITPAAPPVIEIKNQRLHELNIKENPESTVVDSAVQNCLAEFGDGRYLEAGPHGSLVFVPGKNETQEVANQIRLRLPPHLKSIVKIFPLHAKMSSLEQQKALTVYPGAIKVVVATNVAETSLTIPDILYVVDSGLVKQVEIDHEGVKSLVTKQASQAECMQRAGRCGRVAKGYYELTRYGKNSEFVSLAERQRYSDPEIVRKEASRTILRLSAADISIDELDLLNPMPEHLQKIGHYLLRLHGAMDDEDAITRQGKRMDRYPLETVSARIMVEAERFHEGIRAYLAATTAAREVGGLQRFGRNVGKEWKQLTDRENSDLLVQLDLFIAAQYMTPAEIIEADLDISSINKAREHYQKVAKRAGIKTPPALTPPSEEDLRDIEHCIVAGYLPTIYKQVGPGQFVHGHGQQSSTIRELSNRSVVSGENLLVAGDPYRVQMSGEAGKTIHTIENVTATSMQQISIVAAKQMEAVHDAYEIRDGKPIEIQRLTLFGMDLGRTVERAAEASPGLRHKIIEHAIQHPGSEQMRLRRIKEQLEALDKRAKGHVQKFTHEMLLTLIDHAAPPDITLPSDIEDHLRHAARHITLDFFISPEQVAAIHRDAPDVIHVDNHVFPITYRLKKPVVQHYNPKDVLALSEDLELPDGRVVKFYYKDPHEQWGKYYTITQLARILREQP